ncbi:MAG: ABC transporter permease [Dehalococcoidia bacterium]|nr:ABC transporter permease [Dehalococcoidia bacterium]
MSSDSALGELVIAEARPRTWRGVSWLLRFIRTQPLGAAAVVVIVVIGLGAIFAPLLRTTDPVEFGRDVLAAPGGDHWFGTTRQGRDVYSRVLYGGRVSLLIGIEAVAISILGGTVLALIAGYFKGVVDGIVMRIADLVLIFPGIVLALAISTAFGRGLGSLTVAVAIIFTPAAARVIRGAVLQESAMAYVAAAQVIGASPPRIMFRHILPNILPLMIVMASAALPAAILTEAGLSFLGVGVAVGEPSWGADLSGDSRQYFVQAWWIAVFPGAALSLTVLAFNLLGDSLRDVLDPRLRGSKLR